MINILVKTQFPSVSRYLNSQTTLNTVCRNFTHQPRFHGFCVIKVGMNMSGAQRKRYLFGKYGDIRQNNQKNAARQTREQTWRHENCKKCNNYKRQGQFNWKWKELYYFHLSKVTCQVRILKKEPLMGFMQWLLFVK